MGEQIERPKLSTKAAGRGPGRAVDAGDKEDQEGSVHKWTSLYRTRAASLDLGGQNNAFRMIDLDNVHLRQVGECHQSAQALLLGSQASLHQTPPLDSLAQELRLLLDLGVAGRRTFRPRIGSSSGHDFLFCRRHGDRVDSVRNGGLRRTRKERCLLSATAIPAPAPSPSAATTATSAPTSVCHCDNWDFYAIFRRACCLGGKGYSRVVALGIAVLLVATHGEILRWGRISGK
jgi:hypothetical protein